MCKKILYLTLKKPQFQVTVSGEKKSEFRRPSKWILSRVLNKQYDFVKFTNGYGSDKPSFRCEFKGWKYAEPKRYVYSNGLVVNTDSNYIEIVLGCILEVENYKNEI
ncbi:hypothetical protein H7Y21_00985 [Arenimonas sp.]|nr:hypothetical protein [Candidatus Parcubacteria bacterium]